MKTYLKIAALALLGLLIPGAVQAQTRGQVEYRLSEDWDLDALTFTAPWFANNKGEITEPGTLVPIKIQTSPAASTTVTAATTGTSPFFFAVVGDEITVIVGGVPTVRYITAKASSDSITVGPTSIDLSGTGVSASFGYTYRFRRFTTGTAATSGYIPVHQMSGVTFWLAIDQIVTTSGIDYKVECRNRGNGVPDVVALERNVTTVATTGTIKIPVADGYDDCRIMLRMNSTDDGGDLTTNLEVINIFLRGFVKEK